MGKRCCIGRGVAAIRHMSGHRGYTYYAMMQIQPCIYAMPLQLPTGTVYRGDQAGTSSKC